VYFPSSAYFTKENLRKKLTYTDKRIPHKRTPLYTKLPKSAA
jgi:hypothetical protein